MQEGPLLMTKAERDRLVVLRKAKRGLITHREAAVELDVSIRHVKRLVRGLKEQGDSETCAAVIDHLGNRGYTYCGASHDA